MFWLEPNNFNFSIFTPSSIHFDTLYPLVTSELILGSLLKGFQNLSNDTKILCFEGKKSKWRYCHVNNWQL